MSLPEVVAQILHIGGENLPAEHGSFEPMVGEEFKSSVLSSWPNSPATERFTFSPILHHLLPFLILSVLFILDTNWTRQLWSRARCVIVKY